MKEKMRNLATNLFDAGEKLKVSKDGRVKLPVSFDHEQEVLFFNTENGYKLVPLVPDVKKAYLEVTTQCNFSCYLYQKFLERGPRTNGVGDF